MMKDHVNADDVVKSPIYCVAVIFQNLNILHLCCEVGYVARFDSL